MSKKAFTKAPFGRIFKNRAFVTLWINQILLQVSYNMLNVSLIILVFRLTNSNTMAASFILMAMLPIILFGIFAGVIADRFDKRKILLFTDIGIGTAMLLFIPVQTSAVLILAVAFLLNIVFQFFIPAEAATLPSVVDREDLYMANAIFQFTPTAALILGASSAGPIVAHFGYNPIFILGAVATFATFFIRRALPSLPPEAHMAFDRNKEGFAAMIVLSKKHAGDGLKFIFGNRRVWISILILAFIQSAFSMVAALAPGFMEQVLKIEATDASIIILMPLGLGAVISAYLTASFWSRVPRRTIILRGLLICGAGMTLMALTPLVGHGLAHREFLVSHIRPFSRAFTVSIWVSLFALILGFGAAQVIIPAQTALQQETPNFLRGRVFAIWAFLTSLGVALPSLIAGVAADIFGVTAAMIAVGLMILTFGFLGLKSKYLLAHFRPKRFLPLE